MVGLRRSSKTLPKVKPAPKKKMSWSVFGVSCLIHYSFLESRRNHYVWEVCSANRWDEMKTATPAVSIGQQNGPNSSPGQCPTACRTTNTSKLNELGYRALPHPQYSPDLLPTTASSSISTTCCRENAPATIRRQKMLSKSLSNPEAQIFMLQEQTNLFLIGKNVLIVIDPIFDW